MFAPHDPHWQGFIPVGDGHELWVEDCGARAGIPVVFLHGGPGSGCSAAHRGLFDPQRYRAFLFDQRGAGRSRPLGALNHNTTASLVADIETIRRSFGVARWLVVGGSWGSLLGLRYAMAHPDRVAGLVLRGIFMGSEAELAAFLDDRGDDANAARQALLALAPDGRVIEAYAHAILDAPPAEAHMLAWLNYERALMGEAPLCEPIGEGRRAGVRIQMHYLRNRFFQDETFLAAGLDRLHDVPAVLVHGAADRVCPPATAARLHALWPQARYEQIAGAGHNGLSAPIADAVIRAMNTLTTPGG